MATLRAPVSQCQKPRGWLGRFTLWRMNSSHSKLTDWGLAQIAVETLHDPRCWLRRWQDDLQAGGGRATGGSLRRDYSEESVAATKKTMHEQ